MSKLMKSCLAAAAAAVFAAALPAQTPAPASTSATQDLGAWWDRSSLSYPRMPTEFLFHGTGNVHWMNAQGNTEGNVYGGGLSLIFRKRRFTDDFFETLQKNSITYAFNAGSAHFTENTLLNQLDFDLTPHVMAVAGVEDYRNTMIFMDRRLTEYGGVGYTPKASEQFYLNLIAAVGHSSFLFDRNGIDAINPAIVASLPTLSPGSAGGDLIENLRYKITPAVSLEQSASYMKYDQSILGHRWEFAANFVIPVSKRLSVMPGYQIKDEANVYTTALHLKPQDRTFNLGLGITF